MLQLQPTQDMRNEGVAGMNWAIESSPGKCKKHKGVHSPSANHKQRHSKSPKTRSLGCLPTFTHCQFFLSFMCFPAAICGSLLLPFLALSSGNVAWCDNGHCEMQQSFVDM